MDISAIVSTEFEELSPDTPVSKLTGVFDDPDVKGVVVSDDGDLVGVVTRRQLTTSHHSPEEKLASLVWHAPTVAPDENVREVARLMIDSGTQLLPVVEGDSMVGVVTADELLEAVQSFLEAATVGDAYSEELISIEPQTSFGKALHSFRDNRIAHLPVVDEGSAVGVVSLYDVTDIAVRATTQSQGGDAGGTDPFGGEISSSSGRARRGGFGAREGERDRLLDLPVRDVMVTPVRTVTPDETLEDAVAAMFDAGVSSLVVTRDGEPDGILTKTDILDALTWEAEGNRAVQLYGSDLLDDMNYDEVVSMIDAFDDMDGGTNVLDAKIHLHEHNETRRGTPLLLARIRLYTDGGLFMASGEGYGASHALGEAKDTLERRIRDNKTYAQTKKHPDEEFWDKRFGWWLES
ncbi:CBS domain protein [Natronomonas pharaonis DSM 2160]|uniref:CBS domain protein n=1 Tax=Natronomonas pharaonis (strain ATCC 35678 / DSM 2160 / CIP 103997 / JCM 8858 / NBRC 14720 / NCIMB 2260 / Gabara) TaxID=348780 RepID=A0A1U7EWR2_NATPD|nr:CBS domain-containing protein [Natronomonas pharaonis]CAI49538.1 CBS domain protein [Natronomonas pharaonis DSM 2160]